MLLLAVSCLMLVTLATFKLTMVIMFFVKSTNNNKHPGIKERQAEANKDQHTTTTLESNQRAHRKQHGNRSQSVLPGWQIFASRNKYIICQRGGMERSYLEYHDRKNNHNKAKAITIINISISSSNQQTTLNKTTINKPS